MLLGDARFWKVLTCRVLTWRVLTWRVLTWMLDLEVLDLEGADLEDVELKDVLYPTCRHYSKPSAKPLYQLVHSTKYLLSAH